MRASSLPRKDPGDAQPTQRHCWDRFHKRFMSTLPKSSKVYIALEWKIIIWLDHIFAHATTTLLSWHVQNRDLIRSIEMKISVKRSIRRFQSWVYRAVVKYTPGSLCVRRLSTPDGVYLTYVPRLLQYSQSAAPCCGNSRSTTLNSTANQHAQPSLTTAMYWLWG